MAFNRPDGFLMFVFNFGQFAAVSVPMENKAFHFSALAFKFLMEYFAQIWILEYLFKQIISHLVNYHL